MIICNPRNKVFYHLEELDDALRYALGAGPKFDVTSGSEYVQTLLSKCIDEYIRLCVAAYENKEDATKTQAIDPRLVAIVERMFDKCFTEVSGGTPFQITVAVEVCLDDEREQNS